MGNIISRLKALEKSSARGEMLFAVGVDVGTTDEDIENCLQANGVTVQPRDLLILVQRRFGLNISTEPKDAPTFLYAKPMGR